MTLNQQSHFCHTWIKFDMADVWTKRGQSIDQSIEWFIKIKAHAKHNFLSGAHYSLWILRRINACLGSSRGKSNADHWCNDAGVLTLLSKHDNLHSPLEISLCYQIQQTLGKTYFATRRKDRKLIIPCVFIDSACIFYHDILNSSEN